MKKRPKSIELKIDEERKQQLLEEWDEQLRLIRDEDLVDVKPSLSKTEYIIWNETHAKIINDDFRTDLTELLRENPEKVAKIPADLLDDKDVPEIIDEVFGKSSSGKGSEESLMKPNSWVSQSKAMVEIPPGSSLLGICRKVFSKNFVTEVLEQTITDMQFEYIEAIDAGHKWHRRWICVRGYMSFGLALFCGLSATVGKKLVDAWKAVNLS